MSACFSACFSKFIKWVFMFFNSLFLATGISLIIIGVKTHSTFLEIGIITGTKVGYISTVIIVAGVIITLMAAMACLGALIENTLILGVFNCVLVLIIVLEVGTGAAFYVFHSRTIVLKASSGIRQVVQKLISDRTTIDNIQSKFKCCGISSYENWSILGKSNVFPDSCCKVKAEGCGQNIDNIHKTGCAMVVVKNLLWVGAVCLALGILEVAGVVFGICLCLSIKGKQYLDID